MPEHGMPDVGDRLGDRYRLDHLIARGGNTMVFRGMDLQLDLEVAVKVIQIDLDSGVEGDLKAEAQAAMRLSHPFIARTFHWQRFSRCEALIMEYVRGPNLQSVARERPGLRMGEAEVAGYMIDLLDALEHAHDAGVIHNDIKPRNLLVAPGDVLKVCDFGIAKRREVNWHRQARWIVGTVAFMAPERIRHEEGTAVSDLYSVGATMFNLLDGRPPFGVGPEEAFDGHLRQPVPRSRDIPGDLMAVIDRAMQKSPRERFRSAREMGNELRRLGYSSRFGSQKTREEDDAGVFDDEARLWAMPEMSDDPLSVYGASVERPDPWLSKAAPPEPVRPPPVIRAAGLARVPSRSVRYGMSVLRVPSFRLSPLPVTRADWAEWLSVSGDRPPASWGGPTPPPGTERLPVTGVTLAAARKYARWRGGRLPTASEWLSAAAAASAHVVGVGPDLVSVDARAEYVTHDGIYDLVGNAWEWVEADDALQGDGPGVGVVMGGEAGRRRVRGVPVADCAVDRPWDHVGFRFAADVGEGS